MKEFLEQTIIKKILRYTLLAFLTLVAQNMLFTQLRISGVCPMILPAVMVAIGMFEGPNFGVAFGLIIGIFADMAYIENTILFTVLLPTIGFFSAFLESFYINKRFVAFMVLSLAASVVTAFMQMVLTLVGDSWSIRFITTAAKQVLVSFPFSALAFLLPKVWNR